VGLVHGGAVVTGASRGIGAAVAIALARAGADVVVHYNRSAEPAEAVVEVIRSEGGRAVAVQADLEREADVLRLAVTAQAALDEIGILVSNAAVPFAPMPLAELTWANFERELAVMPRAFFLLAQAFLPGMVKCGCGRLIAIGSTLVDVPVRGSYTYVTAKAGLGGIVRVLALEAGEHGTTVNLVVPGFTATDRAAGLSEESRQAYAARAPMGRLGTPEDVAAAVLFLASEEAQYVTGTSLLVDGGYDLS
jgi:3-oxoacyl-[acyl-carrier protein] reductase